VSLKTGLAQPQPIAACIGLSTWCEQTAPVRPTSLHTDSSVGATALLFFAPLYHRSKPQALCSSLKSMLAACPFRPTCPSRSA